ncbi:PilN domain-containing protein [Pelotomaculum propionicicum]|uniref:PilN domain-containing protein n=1 Tax=Pelotomaculum propionicicum TaxID=258475 RepID=UPI003B7625BA
MLPQQLQREGTIDVRRLAVITGFALPAAAALVCYIIFLINFAAVKNDLAETRAQLSYLAPAVSRVEGMIKERAELEAAVGEFDGILVNHITWSGLLNDLGNIAPVDLWLTGLEISNKPPGNDAKEPDPYARPNLVLCRGIAGTLPSIGIFIRNLSGLPYFEEIKLVRANAVSGGIEFEITARVKDRG